MKKEVLKRNVPIMAATACLMWGRFFIPVLALFYIASKVSLTQFSIIMSVFSLSILLLEVPTGVIADLLGKKKTLILSRSFYVMEIFLLAFFNGFWIFLVAKIISGFGVSLSSGTTSAMLYDTLKKQGRAKEHKRINGFITTLSNVFMAVVFIIGAFLFSINYKLPAIVSLPIISVGLVLTFFLEEPYITKKKLNIHNYFKHMKEGISYFRKSNFVKHLAFLSFFTSAAIVISLSMSSAYFEKILIPVSLIGVIAFASSMITAFISKKAHKWEDILKEKKSIFIIQFFVVIGIVLMSLMLPYWGLLFYFIIPFIYGFEQIVFSDYLNRNIKSSHRATLLSLNNMFGNLGIFLLFPLVGYLIKVKSFAFSYSSLAIIILIGYSLIYFYLWRNRIK